MTVSFLRHQARSNDKNQHAPYTNYESQVYVLSINPHPPPPNTNKNRAAPTARPLTCLEIRLLHLLDGVGNLALGGGDRHLLARAVTQQGLAKRRFVANLVLQRISLNWAYHSVRLF